MKRLIAALMYTALLTGANLAAAEFSDISAMREGDMKKLTFHSDAKPVSDRAFEQEDGTARSLANYHGKTILLNFWATWCAPCRHEMPMLSEIQTQLGSDDFEVVTIATGRNALPKMKKFFDDIGVDNLPLHKDPQQRLARDMGVLGLPITVLIDPKGREIARMRGDADWSSQNAKDILQNVIAHYAD